MKKKDWDMVRIADRVWAQYDSLQSTAWKYQYPAKKKGFEGFVIRTASKQCQWVIHTIRVFWFGRYLFHYDWYDFTMTDMTLVIALVVLSSRVRFGFHL